MPYNRETFNDEAEELTRNWSSGILADYQIAELANIGMIEPFVPSLVSTGAEGIKTLSYGLSSAGYDCRLDPLIKYAMPTGNRYMTMLDAKAQRQSDWEEASVVLGKVAMLPNVVYLGSSLEYFRLPKNICAVCFGKSTYARVGIHILTTPLEPEWEGNITLEFVSLLNTPHDVAMNMLYVNEGIAQIQFHLMSGAPKVTYRDRRGKYQGQTGITLSRV
jgi:dCTP deaminase